MGTLMEATRNGNKRDRCLHVHVAPQQYATFWFLVKLLILFQITSQKPSANGKINFYLQKIQTKRNY